jgi:hypothetical protein
MCLDDQTLRYGRYRSSNLRCWNPYSGQLQEPRVGCPRGFKPSVTIHPVRFDQTAAPMPLDGSCEECILTAEQGSYAHLASFGDEDILDAEEAIWKIS